MTFELATPTRIVFGAGALARVPDLVHAFGAHALVVTGSTIRRAEPLIRGLKENGIEVQTFPVRGEPTLDIVRQGVLATRGCHFVVGFGGGSAIDAAKAIAGLASNSGEPLDYLEVIGRGQPLVHPSLPFIAIPTTAGTGAEVTRNAVLGSPEHGVKASLRSPLLLARIAVVDPELTYDLPPNITAYTGLDALTQVIEPYVSNRANPMTDLFCREGMRKVAASLTEAFRNGQNREARESMSWASLLGGLALANAGLGVVHGFAAPLGGMLDAPHGALCAAVLRSAMTANIRALRQRAPEHPALPRYAEVARILTGQPDATPEGGAAWIGHLCRSLEIRPLRSYGLKREQTPLLVENAAKANSMKANPIVLTPAELTAIVEHAL